MKLNSSINNHTETKKNIEQKTNNKLKEVFEIIEIDPNSKEWKEFSYNNLDKILKKIFELKDRSNIKEVLSLLKEYHLIYKTANDDIKKNLIDF